MPVAGVTVGESIVPVIGTSVGGAVGGFVGRVGGIALEVPPLAGILHGNWINWLRK